MLSNKGVYVEDPIHEYWRLRDKALAKEYERIDKIIESGDRMAIAVALGRPYLAGL